MIAIPVSARVYLAMGATDMRKGCDGFSMLAQRVLAQDPLSGHLFVFRAASEIEPPCLGPIERTEAFNALIKNSGAVIEYRGNAACYVPSKDIILMPPDDLWTGTATSSRHLANMSVHLHEISHWSGHPARLNRDFRRRRAHGVRGTCRRDRELFPLCASGADTRAKT